MAITAACLAAQVVLGASPREAAPVTLVVGLIAFGGALVLASPKVRDNGPEVGRGLVVSGLLALAVLWLQSDLDRSERERQAAQDERRAAEAARNQLLLQLTVRRDLRGIDLRRQDLRGVYLRGKNFSGANMRGADLRGALLADSDLNNADLVDADLRGADLSNVTMRGAELLLERARFDDADLRGARIALPFLPLLSEDPKASFDGANLSYSRISGPFDASFRDALFYGAELDGHYWGTDFRGATFGDKTKFEGWACRADFREARFADADFREAFFHQSLFAGARVLPVAKFQRVDFRGSDMRGIRFVRKIMSAEQGMTVPPRAYKSPFQDAIYDGSTRGAAWLHRHGGHEWTSFDLPDKGCGMRFDRPVYVVRKGRPAARVRLK